MSHVLPIALSIALLFRGFQVSGYGLPRWQAGKPLLPSTYTFLRNGEYQGIYSGPWASRLGECYGTYIETYTLTRTSLQLLRSTLFERKNTLQDSSDTDH